MMLIFHCNTDLHYISVTLTATVECVWFWDLYSASPAQYFNVQLFLLLSVSQGRYGCLFAIYLTFGDQSSSVGTAVFVAQVQTAL